MNFKNNEGETNREKIAYTYVPIQRNSTNLCDKNYENGTSKKDKTIIKLVSFIAFVFFCFNLLLIGVVFFNIKNNYVKKFNLNYYNVSVSGDGISTYAVQSALQSSVCIAAGGYAYDENSFYNNTASRGSGVILSIDFDEDYIYVLTCYHVISGYNSSIYVLFSSSSKPIKATLVGYSSTYDVAVIKIFGFSESQSVSEISIKNSQLVSVGESVFAVGNSLSGGLSVTSGVISRVNKEVIVEDKIARELQTDASINPGNSGGGLFNNSGEFIGIINAKLSSTSSLSSVTTVEGTAFAIPSTLAISIAKSIIANNGFPSSVNLGVTFLNYANLISTINLNGNIVEDYEVRVSSVENNSISSGLLNVNDIILSFTYYDLQGNLNEVQMINKYCFEDISFDILTNSPIEFKIISPLFNEEKYVTIYASDKIIQQ